MHAGDLLFLGARRLAAQQGTEFAVGKRLRDRPQTAGILRVPEVRDVIFASGVTEKASGHRGTLEALPVHLRRSRSEEHTSELQSLMRLSYAVFCVKNKKRAG